MIAWLFGQRLDTGRAIGNGQRAAVGVVGDSFNQQLQHASLFPRGEGFPYMVEFSQRRNYINLVNRLRPELRKFLVDYSDSSIVRLGPTCRESGASCSKFMLDSRAPDAPVPSGR